MPKRKMKESCHHRCRKKCCTHISPDDRNIIFSHYWKLKGIEQKRMFLSKLVKKVPIQRRRKRMNVDGPRRNRTLSLKYHLLKRDEVVEVCQNFFLNTLDISRRQIRTVLEKVTEAGTLEPDQRGHGTRQKIDNAKMEEVVEHICQFKTVESHYVRKDTKFQYLPSTLSIKTMHRMYKIWCDESNSNPVIYDTYRTIVNEKFNLKFQLPKKDRCDRCEAWENTKNEERSPEDIQTKKEHDDEKSLSRFYKTNIKRQAKECSTTCASAFDFQKTLLAPVGNSSSFYYSQRLRIYHLTLTDLTNLKHVNCYLWSENNAKKGANEVASSLLMFLKDLQQAGIKDVYLFCDRCAGQNCNRIIFLMLSLAVQWFLFDSINLNFFVTGHSQNENDTIHALVERDARKLNTSTLDQWETVIMNALTKNTENTQDKVKMTVINHSNVKDFKFAQHYPLYSKIFKSTCKENGNSVKWSKIMQARFTLHDQQRMPFKYLYSEENFRCLDLVTESRT